MRKRRDFKMLTLIALPFLLMACVRMKESTERYYYARAKAIVTDAVSHSSLHRCYPPSNLSDPIFIRMGRGSLFPDAARYYPAERVIEYDEDYPRALVHEGAHDLLAFSSNQCLSEIAATMAQRIADLEDANENLQFAVNRSLVVIRKK